MIRCRMSTDRFRDLSNKKFRSFVNSDGKKNYFDIISFFVIQSFLFI